MAALPVSVVVASRGRPRALALCLTGLGQVQYHPFEVVVVADAAGRAAATSHPLGSRLKKVVACDEANLSRARNLGIAAAAGEIVAFIDDDAVPEPDWLGTLAAPFADPAVAASGGYVVGRNGISLQWGARSVDREGWHREIAVGGEAAFTPQPPAGGAIRTEGTNMAVCRSTVVALGGFDEAFRYYLDDTDLDMRIAASDLSVALVPRARVWHHQDASDRRDAGRVPRSLVEIGASIAAFLVRHADPERVVPALAAHRAAERSRLLRHMVAGRLMPGDVGRLLDGFDEGAGEGRTRQGALAVFADPPEPFRPVRDARSDAPRRIVAGWAWRRRRLAAEAGRLVAEGALVQVLRLTPSALYHRRRFVPEGYWLQTGGLFGRSLRDGRLFRAHRIRGRVAEEEKIGPLARSVPILPGNC